MNDQMNGWVTAHAAAPEPEAPPVEDEYDTAPDGPTEPDEDIPGPDIVDRLPITRRPSRTGGSYWYVNAHGGAGATTLAGLTRDEDGTAPDSGMVWPFHPNGQHVVVVARETVTGLEAAANAARQWGSGSLPGGVRVIALVTVPAQPGKLTPTITRSLNVAAGVFPRHYRAEWYPAYMDEVSPAEPSKTDRRLIRTLRKISTKEG